MEIGSKKSIKMMEKESDSNTIWHFTRPETLPKILSPHGGGLLASHIRFLDDETDGALCRPIAEEAGDVFFQLMNISPETPTGNLKNWLRGLANKGIKLSIFATCFCRRIKSPFMWRVYTDKGGYAIGFKKQLLLDSLVSDKTTVLKADNCSYPIDIEATRWSFAERTQKIMKFLPARQAFAMIDASPDSALIETLLDIQQLVLEAAFVKHRFYKDEEEFRILQSPIIEGLDELLWIDGKPRLPLKTKTPLAEIVEEIVVSPLGNVQQNLNSAQLVAEATRIGCHKVRCYSPE